MRLIMQLAERIQVLDHGKTIAFGTPARDPERSGGAHCVSRRARDAMLSVRDLTVRYGRTPAVHELSLEVGEGEIVGLVGPNGAGKSTTLAAIVGLVPAAAGTVTYLGEPLAGLADGGDRQARHLPGARGPAHLHDADRGREPCPRQDGESRPCTGRRRAGPGPRPFPGARARPTGGRRERCPVASSSSSRSAARWSPSRACSCSTSRRSGCRRCWSTRCSRSSPRSGATARTVLLVEQNVTPDGRARGPDLRPPPRPGRPVRPAGRARRAERAGRGLSGVLSGRWARSPT